MQSSAGRTPGGKPPDAAFGAFLFSLGTILLVLIPWVSAAGILAIMLAGFTGGLLIAGGLYLIIKEAAKSPK
jgi:hypothetical protein